MSLQTDAVEARELHKEVESLVVLQGRGDVRLGEKLYFLKKGSLYKKAIGDGITTWVDYLRQPEVNITPHRAGKLIKIYERLVLECGIGLDRLDGVPTYALAYIAGTSLTDPKVIEDLLEDAKVLSEKDFKERYHDEVVQTQRTYTYMVMRKCVETGNMSKVHNIDSASIMKVFNLTDRDIEM